MKPKVVVYPLMLVIASLLIASCQNRPREVLNRKKMERLMYDVYVAEATMENDYQNFNSPEKKEAYINQIFKAHEVTQARWDTSLSWYSDRIDLYLKMNDSVKARLKRAQNEVDALVAQQSIQQAFHDPSIYSASYIPSYYSFAMLGTRNGFRFRLDSTEIASEITEDPFRFSFSVVGIPPTFTAGLSSLLTLIYGDTTLYHYQPITENRNYYLSASKYIENDTLVSINGFIHLQKPLDITTHVQLYDIYLGNEHIDSDLVVSDSIPANVNSEDTVRFETVPSRIDTASVMINSDSVRFNKTL